MTANPCRLQKWLQLNESPEVSPSLIFKAVLEAHFLATSGANHAVAHGQDFFAAIHRASGLAVAMYSFVEHPSSERVQDLPKSGNIVCHFKRRKHPSQKLREETLPLDVFVIFLLLQNLDPQPLRLISPF